MELDAGGYVVVHAGATTSVEGVFSAGDLHDTGGQHFGVEGGGSLFGVVGGALD